MTIEEFQETSETKRKLKEKKERIEIGDFYAKQFDVVMVTRIIKTLDDITIYASDVEFDENNEAVPLLQTESMLTDLDIRLMEEL